MTSTSFHLTPTLKARATLPLAFRDPATKTLLPEIPTSHPFNIFNTLPDHAAIQFGAWGLHSTMHDYSLLLQHLLQLAPSATVTPKVPRILSERSWASLFEGTLGKEAKAQLEVTRRAKVPVEGVNWSTGLFVNEVDWEGRRKKGSAGWGGLAHTHFFLDPESGVAVSWKDQGVSKASTLVLTDLALRRQLLGGTQLLPPDDPNVFPFWTKFEIELYAGLE